VTGRRGRIRKQIMDDLKHTRVYWTLKAEALHVYRPLWRTRVGRSCGTVVGGKIFVCLSVLISLGRWIPSIESRYFSVHITLFMIYNSSNHYPSVLNSVLVHRTKKFSARYFPSQGLCGHRTTEFNSLYLIFGLRCI
jgi:hypothetical protein